MGRREWGVKMALNKQKGNMYGFVTHTWNAIKGKCPHDCSYCYMKRFPQSELHFDEKELKTDLGEGNFIFVGSSCDMFAQKISPFWISKVLDHCKKYPKNKYLFQTKNPIRLMSHIDDFPENSMLGTTIETNRDYPIYDKSVSPVRERAKAMSMIFGKLMVTIEPIMDFDLKELVFLIQAIEPDFVNIGADSKGHNLPEPSWDKVQKLIKELEKFTKVNLKDNLKRTKE